MAWRPKYKQLCAICRKNHILISSRNQFPICTSCSMKQINQPITDEKFRKMFDIDQKLYEESSFLRSIKSNYLRFGSLSEKQIDTFKRVAAELANPVQSNKNSTQKTSTQTVTNAIAAEAVVIGGNSEKQESANEAKQVKPKAKKSKK
ncbi:hypothetical protein HYV85_01890 [Candidatus Woesearchaeota archaeon]|nr:hypothetical protein [Candidatus Woesearchaeota archaeon]